MNEEDVRRLFAALERLNRIRERVARERGGRLWSPSWKIINEQRDERNKQT